MAFFQLDPQSLAVRLRAMGGPPPLTLDESIERGIKGFTIVSVAGFLPWVLADRVWRGMTEVQMYVVCAAVFIGLSGVCLHRLIIGPPWLARFYKLFGLAFTAYAIGWVSLWMWLRGDAGSLAGLFVGTALMGGILAAAFDASHNLVKIIAALFLLNTLGYYAGGWVEGKIPMNYRTAGMLLWGVCYGIGFGAGLGAAFYFCQERARAVISRR